MKAKVSYYKVSAGIAVKVSLYDGEKELASLFREPAIDADGNAITENLTDLITSMINKLKAEAMAKQSVDAVVLPADSEVEV